MPQTSSREDLTPEDLLAAYAMGIFPMAEARDDPEIRWVDPRQRGILPLDGFYTSRSLSRRMRSGSFRITVDTAFAEVVTACADRPETWISLRIQALYQQLFQLGQAHSIEVWHQDRLVGGVYGVTQGAAFFGESMFSKATDASKIALAHAVDRLRAGGFQLFDTQFLTPHLASLGGVEIPRAAYRQLLAGALQGTAQFQPEGYSSGAASAATSGNMQASTQTS